MSALFCCIATIGLHIASQHSAPGYNNHNPGVYVTSQAGYLVGTYYNSERRQSFYAGRTFEKDFKPWASAGVTLGAITGYRRSSVLPMVVPSIKLPIAGTASLRLAYVPRIEKKGAHTVHVAVEFEI